MPPGTPPVRALDGITLSVAPGELVVKQVRQLPTLDRDARWPVYLPDGKTFLYVGHSTGALNLKRFDLASGERRPPR